jgi:hypothetical protein
VKLGVALLLFAAACGLDTVNPAAVAPQPGLPCGELGVVCPDSMCCPQGFTCDSTCPANECCDVGSGFDARSKPIPRLAPVAR